MHSEVARGKGLSEMVSTHSGAHNPYNLLESGEAFFDLPCLLTFSALLLARGSFMEEVNILLALKHGRGRCLVKSVLRIKHRKPSPKRGSQDLLKSF